VIDGSSDPIASRRFDEFFKEANISVEPATLEQARLAREAYRDFGKGSGHPAKLNFGDCFAYALATTGGAGRRLHSTRTVADQACAFEGRKAEALKPTP
jgi:uncharacterized protein with PIN domain